MGLLISFLKRRRPPKPYVIDDDLSDELEFHVESDITSPGHSPPNSPSQQAGRLPATTKVLLTSHFSPARMRHE